jgi:hydroxymethylpyrimidine pyrophosphatase-like HAD family hydrolase
MRYHALACDYDGTIATGGRVDEATAAALQRLRASGRKLILVTGRRLDDLERVFPDLGQFDAVVAENGALLYMPADRDARVLAEPPPEAFLQALRARGVEPLAAGRVVVGTWRPNETVVLEVIRTLGLELQLIFNKGAVMVLPSGVNKATGLERALGELGLSPRNAVGVGDAENDHAFRWRWPTRWSPLRSAPTWSPPPRPARASPSCASACSNPIWPTSPRAWRATTSRSVRWCPEAAMVAASVCLPTGRAWWWPAPRARGSRRW